MCIIAIKPKGMPMFTDEQIKVMFENNSDGAGYMYCANNKVNIVKGFFNVNKLIKSLRSRDFTNTNVVLHFRISTSGLVDGLNCHPYPIFDKNRITCKTNVAIAHNGVLHSFAPSKNSKINDTQVFINEILSKLARGFENDKDKLMLLEHIAGSNKFAILNKHNKVVTIGNFVEDNGYLYSNESYKKISYKYVPISKTEFDYYDDYYDGYYNDKFDEYFSCDYCCRLTNIEDGIETEDGELVCKDCAEYFGFETFDYSDDMTISDLKAIVNR